MRYRAPCFLGVAALAACAAAPVAPAAPPTPPTPVALERAADPHGMPGPGPLTRAHALAANDACAACHTEAAATWRASLHAQAFTNPVFQRAFAKEPSAFCRDCHAPEPEARAIGVGCVTCHDPEGRGVVLAVPLAAEDAATRAPAPHAVVRDAAFATERACADCHDFPFPDGDSRGHDGTRMQRTAGEHAGSAFPRVSCAGCHMPNTSAARPAQRGHGFAVASDPSMLKRALVVRAARRERRLVVDLAPGSVGHAFPTGDLFRRVVVVAEVMGDDFQLLAHEERVLARHFRFEPGTRGGKVQREIGDDRLRGPLHLEVDLGPAADRRAIAWRVDWQRVASMSGEHAEIADVVVIDEGHLPDIGGARAP